MTKDCHGANPGGLFRFATPNDNGGSRMTMESQSSAIIRAFVLGAFLVFTYPVPLYARPGFAMKTVQVKIPAHTKVYCEMQQRVESKKPYHVDQRVRATVWRDVIVDGKVVIPAGSPVDAHISLLKHSKVAGIRGKLEISADGTTAADGSFITLTGGYGKKGGSNMALAITLAAVVFVPLIFIHGKKAVLEPGALFDAYTDQSATVRVQVPAEEEQISTTHVLHLEGIVGPNGSDLEAHVLYHELEAKKRPKALPLDVSVCGVDKLPDLRVDNINGSPAKKVLKLKPREYKEDPEEGCFEGTFLVKLKPLVKQFRRGINRFDVAYEHDGKRISQEVILNVQF